MTLKQILYLGLILGLLTTCYKDPAPARIDFNPQELNFNEDTSALSFTIFNNGDQDLIWELIKSVDWIDSFQTTTGVLHCNKTATITVNIDRSKLASGNNESELKLNEKSITVKAFHNFQPTDIKLSNERIKDLQPINTVVGILTTIDQDPNDKHTYTLVAGAGSEDNSSFKIEDDTLKSGAIFNVEVKTSYNIRIRSTDANGKTIEKTFTITILDSNTPPTDLILDNKTILEKRPVNTTIGNFTTTDNAGDTHIYTLASGAGADDNLNFTIDKAILKSQAIFDFKVKTSYTIRVRSTDTRGEFFEKAFTILIRDSNSPPTAINLRPNKIAENQPLNTLVGQLTSTDEIGDTHTYKFVSGNGDTGNSNFSIRGNEVYSNLSFNYENQTSHTIRVESKDAGNKTYQQVLTILITNVNEAVTDLLLDRNTIQENKAINTIIGVFNSTDIDVGDTHNYALVGGFGDNANFKIEGRILKSAAVFDFETKNSYSIKVRTEDAGGESFEKIFAINILDVREPATDITLSPNNIDENQPRNTLIGNFSSTDTDAGDSHTYSLVSGFGDDHNANFQIIGNSLRSQKSFNFENRQVHTIRVESKDAGNQTFQKNFIIFINDVNDAPSDLKLSNLTVAENEPIGTLVGLFSTVDEDAGDTHTYTLVAGAGDTDNSSFTIGNDTLKTKAVFDYETKSSYLIRVRTRDAGGLFEEKIFNITITNVRAWIRYTAPWARRSGHTAVVFDNKMWVMGGSSTFNFGTPKNDVWYSDDGITWTQATASAGWSARSNHTSVVFDDKIWVIGGRTGTTTPWTTSQNDVWYSDDGITWTEATASAGWTTRMGHASVVFDNKMWITGGIRTAPRPTELQDAWSSTDGITWTRATATVFPGTRYYHASVAFDNKIWVFGGYEQSPSRDWRNDVRRSTDGTTWTEATGAATWLKRQGLAGTVHDGKMWISGGNGSNFQSDIWYSTDGITWTEETTPAPLLEGRTYHAMVAFKNTIWIIAGEISVGGLGSATKNDVWELDP